MSARGAVVLLHAFPCDGRMWAAQADALSAAGWDVVVPDLPGFGESDLLDVEPNLDAVADVVVREMEAQGIGAARIAGLSLGGYVAMNIARRYTDRVRAIMLCDTKASADPEAAQANRERLAQAVLAAPDDTGRILRQSVLPGLLGATTFAARPDVVTVVEGWLDVARAETVAWYQRAMAARPESFGALAALEVPSLVLWGAQDTLSPQADQQAMTAVLRHGREVRIDDAGHLSAVETPAAVSDALVTFLAEL